MLLTDQTHLIRAIITADAVASFQRENPALALADVKGATILPLVYVCAVTPQFDEFFLRRYCSPPPQALAALTCSVLRA
jgi:hypothetical protein